MIKNIVPFVGAGNGGAGISELCLSSSAGLFPFYFFFFIFILVKFFSCLNTDIVDDNNITFRCIQLGRNSGPVWAWCVCWLSDELLNFRYLEIFSLFFFEEKWIRLIIKKYMNMEKMGGEKNSLLLLLFFWSNFQIWVTEKNECCLADDLDW